LTFNGLHGVISKKKVFFKINFILKQSVVNIGDIMVFHFKEERRLRVFEKTMLKRILGVMREAVRLRKSNNGKLQNLYFSPDAHTLMTGNAYVT
jgi:hypothetical protein